MWDARLDEKKVFQLAIARFKDPAIAASFFIHNSGAYIPGDSVVRSLYCPLLERKTILNKHRVADVRKTGGWNISCASEKADSPSFALVYGRDRHLEAERKRMAAGQPYCQIGYSIDKNHSDWQSLLGFGFKQKPPAGSWQRLSELLDSSLFPKATRTISISG